MTASVTSVVFLHGVGQIPQAWQAQVEALPTGWTARAPWVPGLKPTDREPFDLERAAAGVLDVIGPGDDRVHLVGLSVGAMVATRLAATAPERIDRLVLAAGQVRPPRLAARAQVAVLRRMPEERLAAQGISKERLLGVLEAMKRIDLRADLPKISAPTLVLVGTRDRANQASARALAAGIAGASLERIVGGPALNTDEPTAFNRAVFGFLSGSGR